MTWLTIPSARPPREAAETLLVWHKRGYGLMLWRDKEDELGELLPADGRVVITVGEYPGYAKACNWLTRAAFELDKTCDWVVTGGDDTLPDARNPEDIAAILTLHFAGTFGVMQPTGDRFAGGSIDRICGSPWLGREFCWRMYQGTGPYWPEYSHMFVDQELFEVAKQLGVLWQRRDLTHQHNHFMRVAGTDQAEARTPPPHLVQPNSAGHWQFYKDLFTRRQRAGFPGSEPIAHE